MDASGLVSASSQIHSNDTECLLKVMYSWNAVFTPPDTPSQPKEPSIAAELERLSAVIPRVINTRDFDFKSPEAEELLSHVSSDFVAQIDTRPQQDKALSWHEQVSAWRERAEEHPQVHFALTQISSVVDENRGFAQVYMDMEVSGIGDVKLNAMNELRWRQVHGKWVWYHVIGMRGTPGNTGMG